MKLPHQSLTLAAIISLLVLAACQPIQAPSAESETSATAAPARTTTPSHTTTFDATKYQNVWVQAIEEIENDGRSLLRISYPVTEQETINARMEAVTQEFIDEYRMVAAEIEKSYQEYKSETGKEAATFITHYRQHFDVAVANENVIFFDIERQFIQVARATVTLSVTYSIGAVAPNCPSPIYLSTTATLSVSRL